MLSTLPTYIHRDKKRFECRLICQAVGEAKWVRNLRKFFISDDENIYTRDALSVRNDGDPILERKVGVVTKAGIPKSETEL